MDTVFSKIVRGEIPADIVYDDAATIAFLDINPTQKGHVLVVPKEPYPNLLEIDADLLGHLAVVAQTIARAQVEALQCAGTNLIMNSGTAAGQEIFHAHFHVIPRFEGDNALLPPNKTEYAEGEAGTIAVSLRTAVGNLLSNGS